MHVQNFKIHVKLWLLTTAHYLTSNSWVVLWFNPPWVHEFRSSDLVIYLSSFPKSWTFYCMNLDHQYIPWQLFWEVEHLCDPLKLLVFLLFFQRDKKAASILRTETSIPWEHLSSSPKQQSQAQLDSARVIPNQYELSRWIHFPV